MKPRKKANEDSAHWWEAVHKAQDWDEQGLSHRKIADRLNREGYAIGRGKGAHGWTDMAVTRALDRHPKHPVEYPVKWLGEDPEDPNSTLDVILTDRTKTVGTAHHPGDFEDVEQYEAFKREVARQAFVPMDRTKEAPRTYPKLQPRDWTTESFSMRTSDYTDTWTAGEKDWDETIVPMVAEHVRAVGGSFLDRLDRLVGDPVDKAKLRWGYLGLMRRLAIREETVLALKDEVKRLKDGR